MTMSFSEAGNPWRKIYARIGKAAAIEQLAEEAAELSAAALKLSRIVRGENPARAMEEEAYQKMVEELADVYNALDVLDTGLEDNKFLVHDALLQKHWKMTRWYNSLFGKENSDA